MKRTMQSHTPIPTRKSPGDITIEKIVKHMLEISEMIVIEVKK